MLNFDDISKIFFVGMGGISMSALAKYSLKRNINVYGYDHTKSDITTSLEAMGCKICYDLNMSYIVDSDLVVYTCAVGNNPFVNYAKTLHIPVLERADFLREVAMQFDKIIAVAGCHGKTTTTAMLSHIVLPVDGGCAHIGGEDIDYSNLKYINDNVFVTEVCEYKKHIEKITPDYCIITNIELDHVDTYKNLDDITSSFDKLAHNTKRQVVVFQDVNISAKNVIRAGFSDDCDYVAYNIKTYPSYITFCARTKGRIIGQFVVHQIGLHNIKNAICVIALLDSLGYTYSQIKKGLSSFKGVKRRQELLHKLGQTYIYADYAHHPTEVRSSLKAFGGFKKILVVFQSHTYSRTIRFLQDFACVFCDHDVVIYKTYAAREKFNKKGGGKSLYNAINNVPFNKYYFDKKSDLCTFLYNVYSRYNAILILGAGDLYEIIKKWLKRIKNLDK